MGRPAKAIASKTGAITKEKEIHREIAEKLMQGGSDLLEPPGHLTTSQCEIFRFILDNLEESRILGNIDLYVLAQGSIIIDRMIEIEKSINENPTLLLNTKLMTTQDRLFKQFARICNELSLSPQSRAKISISVADPSKDKKTIMDILNEDDEE